MSQIKNPIQQMRLYLSQLFWANQYTERYAQDHCYWFDRMEKSLQLFMPDFKGIRALDLGSGMLQWQTIMLHSHGADVTGVDMEYTRSDRYPDKYWHILRSNGLERMLKTIYWDYVFRSRYLKALQACSPFPLMSCNLDLRQHLAEQIPFEENSFDLVVSHETFEHIADIHAAASEIKRVLKPQGLAYIVVHLFPSISGGHHMAWKFPDTEPSTTVPPWDHLRQRLYPEHPSWLNELREQDYRRVFENLFEIVRWEASVYEGKNLLTDEIKAELKNYSEDELLKKGLIIVVRKPKS